MFRRPTPPTSLIRPLNPWDQEEERLGLAPPDPAATIRKPFKPLNERLLDARKAREATLAQQQGTQPQSLGHLPSQQRDETTRRPRLSLPEPHPTKPSAPARPAAPKTQGGLVADGEEEGFDFPLITRAVQALTHALGHRPKPGETIPQEAVEPYLKALTSDRFDRRADAEFFRHVEGVFRAAYPVTRFDAAGRMIDTPAQPIAFTPFGPAVPRQAQPGVVRANAPAEPEAGTLAVSAPEGDSGDEFRTAQAGPTTRNGTRVPSESRSGASEPANISGQTTSRRPSNGPDGLEDYDLDFVHKNEGFDQDIYVPKIRNAKTAHENSGPTIGFGVDIGQRNAKDMDRLVGLGLDPDLADKLRPYLGMKGQAAERFIQQNPLTITRQEAEHLSDLVYRDIRKQIGDNFDAAAKAAGASVSFSTLDPAMRTVAVSVAINYGPALGKATPRFWRHLLNQDAASMEHELRNFEDELPERRETEADYLKQYRVNPKQTRP